MNIFEVIRAGDFVVLDTETTGLQEGEICQIAVIDANGAVLIDTLVKPVLGIPYEATAIHGITNDQVADAPGFAAIAPDLRTTLTGRHVLVYNAVYDRKMLHKSAEAAGIDRIDWKLISNWHCAMEAFAEIYGDWNDYRQSYKWQKLSTAAKYYNIPQQEPAHTALADCKTTLAVAWAMSRVDGRDEANE